MSLFGKLNLDFLKPRPAADINDPDYVPPSGNIDNEPYVTTVYATTLGPDPDNTTVIAQGDLFDYHLKRTCRWDSMTKLTAVLMQFPDSAERAYEHIRSVRNPNLLLKMLSLLPSKSRLEKEIAMLATDTLTMDEINRVGADGVAPITVMGESDGSEAAIRLFCAKGFSGDTVDACGRTALINAARKGIASNVKALLDSGVKNIDQADDQGLTALHYAAQNTSAPVVAMLVAAGASVNPLSAEKMLPIHMAAMSAVSAEHTPMSPNMVGWSKAAGKECVEILMAHGADINAVSGYGFTAAQLLTALNM